MKTGQVKVNKTKPTKITGHSSFSTLWVRAMPDNDAPVYIGDASVKYETGYPLMPGEQITLERVHPNEVFVIAPETNQHVAWMV